MSSLPCLVKNAERIQQDKNSRNNLFLSGNLNFKIILSKF